MKAKNMTVDELVEIESSLATTIKAWVNRETHGKKKIPANTKLAEIVVLNIKLLFSDSDYGKDMRNFLFKKPADADNKMKDYTISRIQDLYIHICTVFPEWFIDNKSRKFGDNIKKLGYDVNQKLRNELHYGWLIFEIQHALRYFETKP